MRGSTIKAKELDIIEKFPDGRSRGRGKCVPGKKTPMSLRVMFDH